MVKHSFVLGAILLGLLSSGSAQSTPDGTIYVFRRPYVWPARYNVFLDGTRIAEMRSGSYFSVLVSAGTHRLQTTVSAHAVKSTATSLGPDEEVTQVEVRAAEIVCFEMTFADIPHQGHFISSGNWVKTGVFTLTPESVARDRFPGLRPLERKRAFDRRVDLTRPDFP